MNENPIFIFGAGAGKACGGPLTDEILHAAFCDEALYSTLERKTEVEMVRKCLIEHLYQKKMLKRATFRH